MADQALEKAIESRFHEHDRLGKSGESYSALARLAEISHSLSGLQEADGEKWRSRIRAALEGFGTLEPVVSRLKENLERIKRILSIGTRFNDDEIVLVLTLRIEAELMREFLKEWTGLDIDGAWEEVDEYLLSLARSKAHSDLFRSCSRQVSRNWGLPVRSRWLRDFV